MKKMLMALLYLLSILVAYSGNLNNIEGCLVESFKEKRVYEDLEIKEKFLVDKLNSNDKINSLNVVGNFSYTVQNIKNVVCAGDGSVTIVTDADVGTNIGVSIIRQKDGKTETENIVSTGNDTVKFDLLNEGVYEVSFSLEKDGKTETVEGNFTVGSDREDILIKKIIHDDSDPCYIRGKKYLSSFIKGVPTEYRVYELLDDNTLGKEIVGWQKIKKENLERGEHYLVFTDSQREQIKTDKVRVIYKDACNSTTRYDLEYIASKYLNYTFSNLDFKLNYVSCDGAYFTLRQMDPHYLSKAEEIYLIYKGGRYKMNNIDFSVMVPINDFDLDEFGVIPVAVEISICDKTIVRPLQFNREKTSVFLECSGFGFVREKNFNHTPFIQEILFTELTGFKISEYPSGFKPWEFYPDLFDEGSYTSKPSVKGNDIVSKITKTTTIPLKWLTGNYKVEFIYPCKTIKKDVRILDVLQYRRPFIGDHRKVGVCGDVSKKYFSTITFAPSRPFEDGYGNLIKKAELVEAPEAFLKEKGLTLPIELKDEYSWVNILSDRVVLTVDDTYSGDYKVKIIRKQFEYRGGCNILIPESVEEVTAFFTSRVKIEKKPIVQLKSSNIKQRCGSAEFTAVLDISSVKEDNTSNVVVVELQKYLPSARIWMPVQNDIFNLDEDGELEVSFGDIPINEKTKFRFVRTGGSKECLKNPLKEFTVNKGIDLVYFNVFECVNGSRTLKIKVEGTPPFTYQIIEKDDQDVSGSNPVQTEPVFTDLAKGTYKVRVSGECETRDLEFNIQNNIFPKITSSYSCEEGKLNLEIEEDDYLDIEWFKDGVSTGKKGKTVEIENYNPTIGGKYTVKLEYKGNLDASCLNREIPVDLSNTDFCVPKIKLNKTAPATPVGLGDEITYTFTVENVGSIELTNVTVTDPKLGGSITLDKTTLAPGEVVTGTGKYTVTAEDVKAGKVENTATAEGTGPKGKKVNDTSDSSAPEKGNKDNSPSEPTVVPVVIKPPSPAIKLNKTAPATPVVLGDEITYTFTVENVGNVELTNVTIEDTKLGGTVALKKTTLAPGEVTTVTAKYIVTEKDLNSGSGRVYNIAWAEGTDPKGKKVIDYSDSSAPEKGNKNNKPSNPTVVPIKGLCTDSSIDFDEMEYEIGSKPIELRFRLIPRSGGYNDLEDYYEPIPTYNFSYSTEDGVIDSTNTTPVQDYNSYIEGVVVVSQPGTYKVSVVDQDLGCSLERTIVVIQKGDFKVEAGETKKLCQNKTVTLEGSTEIKDATYLWTTENGIIDSGKTTLNPVVSKAGTYKLTVTSSEGYTVKDTVVVTVGDCPSFIKLNKTAPATPVGLGDEITYTFTVENVGGVELTNVTVTDPKLGGVITLDKTTLAPGEVAIGTAKYTVTAEDVNAGQVENTATAEGTDPKGKKVNDTSDSSAPEKGNKDNTPNEPTVVPVKRPLPAIKLNKTAPATPVGLGDEITYTFTVENVGEVELENVGVYDEMLQKSITLDKKTLAPGEVATGTEKYIVTAEDVKAGKVENTARVSGYSEEKRKWVDDISDSSSPEKGNKDNTPADPTVVPVVAEKQPSPAIKLNKTAPSTPVNVGDEITYTFTVENVGDVELTNVTVDDPKLGGVVTVSPTTLAPGEVATGTKPYTVTQSDLDAGKVENTATAVGTDPKGGKVTDTSDSSAPEKGNKDNTPGDPTVVPVVKEKVTRYETSDGVKLQDPTKGKEFTMLAGAPEKLDKDGVKYYKDSEKDDNDEHVIVYVKEKLTKWVDEAGNPLKDDLKQKDFSDDNPDTIVKDGVTYYKKETKNEEGVRTYVYTKEKLTKFVNEDNKTEELAEAEKAKDFVDGEEVLTKDGVKYYKSSTEPTIEGNEKTVYYTKEKLTKWVDEAGNPLKDELKQKDFSDENPDTLEKDGVTYYKKETKNEEGVRTYVYTKEKVTRYETEDGVKLQDPTTGKEFTMLAEAPSELEKDGVTYVKTSEKDENGEHVIVYVKKKEPVQPVAPKVTRYETEDGTKLKDSTTGKEFTMKGEAPSELEKDGVTYVKTSEKDENGDHVIVYVKKKEPVQPVAPKVTRYETEDGVKLKDSTTGKEFTMKGEAPSELEKDGVTYVKRSEKDENGEHVIVYVKKKEPVKITTEWVDEEGNPLKGLEPGKQEAGTLKGYEIVETVTDEKGNVKHIFKQIKTDYQFVDGGQAPIKDVEGEYKTHKKGEELTGIDGNKYVVVEWLDPVKGIKVIKVKPVKTTICGDGSKGKEIVIYNEFSPNGDGINDYLHIDNIDSECYNNKLEIFNRWGNTVWEGRGYNNTTVRFEGISGSGSRAVMSKSDKLPAGTYYYVLDLGDGSKLKKGWIYINR